MIFNLYQGYNSELDGIKRERFTRGIYAILLSSVRTPGLDLTVFSCSENQLLLIRKAETPDKFLAMGSRQSNHCVRIKAPGIALGHVNQLEHLLTGRLVNLDAA